ncbi:hypothetical protein JOF34_001334 [Microbacterium amylolyticum]|uniref:Uncharacterized protein n=1 Tax=Microbacterium amylolyticum TaxID=936337 RepID=A0ABS4ZI90_9MICO|nr:hypothetical protein [Microbacterium amylolyticum]
MLEWSIERAGGDPFEIFVEVDDEKYLEFSQPRRSALVKLHGDSPLGVLTGHVDRRGWGRDDPPAKDVRLDPYTVSDAMLTA